MIYLVILIVAAGLFIYPQWQKQRIKQRISSRGAPTPTTAGTNPANTTRTTQWKRSVTSWSRSSGAKGGFVLVAILLLILMMLYWNTVLDALDGRIQFDYWTTSTDSGARLALSIGHFLANLVIWVAAIGLLVIIVLMLTGKAGVVGRRISSFSFNSLTNLITTLAFLALVGWLGHTIITVGADLLKPSDEQTVEFSGLTTSNVVGHRKSISVTPVEKWVLRTGTVRGQNPHPNWYWVCATTDLSILRSLGRIFITREISQNQWEYQFTQEARLRLVQEGVTAVTITHEYFVGRPGRNSPCDQEVL